MDNLCENGLIVAIGIPQAISATVNLMHVDELGN